MPDSKNATCQAYPYPKHFAEHMLRHELSHLRRQQEAHTSARSEAITKADMAGSAITEVVYKIWSIEKMLRSDGLTP